MIPPPFNVDTVTRVRPSVILDHGREIADWDAAPAVPDLDMPGCSVQPGPSSEFLENRASVTVQWTVFAPGADLDVRSSDGIRWQATMYQVDGEPLPWRDPTGRLDHTVIALVERSG